MESTLKGGNFSFTSVTPGKYLVEFWIDGYSVNTWWAEVPESGQDLETTVVAYPRYKLTVHPCGKGAGKDATIECGVAYRDALLNIDLKAKTVHPSRNQGNVDLRVNQSGTNFELYCSKLKVAVIDGPFVDDASALEAARSCKRSAWFSWNGALTTGQLIVLIDDHTKVGASIGVSADATFAMALEVKGIVTTPKADAEPGQVPRVVRELNRDRPPSPRERNNKRHAWGYGAGGNSTNSMTLAGAASM